MMELSIRTLLIVASSIAAISAANAAPPTMTAATSKGPTLTDQRGMSLYTFDKDKDGKSACNGPCAANWPALKAEDSDQATDTYTVITRDDSSKQWAHKGKPLYTFVKDQSPAILPAMAFSMVPGISQDPDQRVQRRSFLVASEAQPADRSQS